MIACNILAEEGGDNVIAGQPRKLLENYLCHQLNSLPGSNEIDEMIASADIA